MKQRSFWTLTFFQRRVLPLFLLAVAAGDADAARGGRDSGDPHVEGRASLHDGRLIEDRSDRSPFEVQLSLILHLKKLSTVYVTNGVSNMLEKASEIILHHLVPDCRG